MNIKAAIDQAKQDCGADADEASSLILAMPDTHANKMRVLSALLEVFEEDDGAMDYGVVIGLLRVAQEELTGVFAQGGDK